MIAVGAGPMQIQLWVETVLNAVSGEVEASTEMSVRQRTGSQVVNLVFSQTRNCLPTIFHTSCEASFRHFSPSPNVPKPGAPA